MAQVFYSMGGASGSRLPACIESIGFSWYASEPFTQNLTDALVAAGSGRRFFVAYPQINYDLSLNLQGEFGDFEVLLIYRRMCFEWDVDDEDFALGLYLRHEGFTNKHDAGQVYACVAVGALMLDNEDRPDRKLSLYRLSESGDFAIASNATALTDGEGDALQWATNEDTCMRVNVTGSTVRAKVWYQWKSEPEGWQIEEAVMGMADTGKIGIRLIGNGSGTLLKSISVGTDGDPAPEYDEAGPRRVAGIVNLPDKSPAAGYRVLCHHRQTGALLAEQLTEEDGSFDFWIYGLGPDDKVYCIAIDQLGNSMRAPIKDMITPEVS